jgi:glucose-6-phosphate dehydrogenase assembly protein OpcA
MAEPVTAARVSRACPPAEIDEELALLWRDAGRDGPVARALMANLVVFKDCPAKTRVDLSAPLQEVPVAEIARRHPSRVILLYHGGLQDLRSPNEATISILLFGDPPMRFGVEQIAIRSACAEASLPSIVRRLALGDIPTSIWWTEDFDQSTPLHSLVTMGRQLLYDSRQWRDVKAAVLALAPLLDRPDAPDLADLNWRRLAPMQQAIAEALKAAPPPAPRRSLRLRIQHRPGDAALAWLLAGWFCSRLEWSTPDWPVVLEERADRDEVLSVAFSDDRGGEATATMNGNRVLVNYRTGMPPFSMAVPPQTDAEGVAAELRNLGFDVALHDALAALARRFASESTSS